MALELILIEPIESSTNLFKSMGVTASSRFSQGLQNRLPNRPRGGEDQVCQIYNLNFLFVRSQLP